MPHTDFQKVKQGRFLYSWHLNVCGSKCKSRVACNRNVANMQAPLRTCLSSSISAQSAEAKVKGQVRGQAECLASQLFSNKLWPEASELNLHKLRA